MEVAKEEGKVENEGKEKDTDFVENGASSYTECFDRRAPQPEGIQ